MTISYRSIEKKTALSVIIMCKDKSYIQQFFIAFFKMAYLHYCFLWDKAGNYQDFKMLLFLKKINELVKI